MIRGFFDGLGSYLTAIRITNKYRLWGYFLIPAIISIVLAAGIIYGAWGLSDNVGAYVERIFPFEWGEAYAAKVGKVLGIIIVIAFGLILFKNLVIALASPFMSFLSEKVERLLEGNEAPPFNFKQFTSDLIRGIRIAIRLLVRELLFTMIVMLIGLVPLFSVLVPFLLFFVQSYYAGFGNMDFTLERYYRVRGSVKFVRENRGLAVGNGAVYLFLFFSVIGFPLALPLGTIAATVETLKRLHPESSFPV